MRTYGVVKSETVTVKSVTRQASLQRGQDDEFRLEDLRNLVQRAEDEGMQDSAVLSFQHNCGEVVLLVVAESCTETTREE